MRPVATRADSSSPADTIVLVDGPNLSGVVLDYYLPHFSVRYVFNEQDADAAWSWLLARGLVGADRRLAHTFPPG